MSRTVDLLRPGIRAMFKCKGYDAEVWEEARTGKLVVRVSKGKDYHEERSYDIPGTNAEISPKLRTWVEGLL